MEAVVLGPDAGGLKDKWVEDCPVHFGYIFTPFKSPEHLTKKLLREGSFP